MSNRPKLGGRGLIWSSPQDWERVRRPEFCAICLDGGPSNVLVPLTASFATGASTAPLPGYVSVVARRHVVEPFELTSPDLEQFWQDAMIVGRALAQLMEPAKINYEIHGNSIPHLHMHIYPRSAGDPYVGRAISWDATFERSDADLRAIRDAIERERVVD